MNNRQGFARFLTDYANGNRDANEWLRWVVEHYHDERLEEIRREVVRRAIADDLSPEELRAWAAELTATQS